MGLGSKDRAGFTLIELLVVVAIMAALAAIVVPKVIGQQDRALVAKAKQDIRAIQTAMEMYRLDNFDYPSTEQGIRALIQRPTGQPEPRNWQEGGYLPGNEVPRDPWGQPYQYLKPGVHGEIDIFTLGRDGRPGGEGPDADIGNWDLDR